MYFQNLKGYLKEDFGKLGESGKKMRGKFHRKKREGGDVPTGGTSSGKQSVYVVLWSRKTPIIIATVVFMLILTVCFAVQNRDTKVTTLTLNYEEASSGLNPNGTRYNMYELKSTEVMQRAIEYMGIGDQITPEELSNNISISNTDTKAINTSDNEYFISTSFTVEYKRNKQVREKISTDDMMTLICKAYNDVFHDNYADKRTALVFTEQDTENMEYVEIGDDMEYVASRMKLYLTKRVKENGTFKSDETGQTFQTLQRMIDNLISYDISKYESFVLETGLARDKEQIIETLNYKNSVLDRDYQKQMADYAARQNTISMYDESMIGTVMIPSVNDEEEYYMSRTNIGIDYLAKDAEIHLTQAKEILKEIEINQDIITKIKAGSPTSSDYKQADEMIELINDEFETISSLAMLTDREYIRYKTKDYITFTETEKTFAQAISLEKVVVCGIIFLAVLCLAVYFAEKRRQAGRRTRS